jgi:hypothetical protein
MVNDSKVIRTHKARMLMAALSVFWMSVGAVKLGSVFHSDDLGFGVLFIGLALVAAIVSTWPNRP